MSTAPLQQVPDSAIDLPGLSIATSPRLPADPRQGSAYDNTVMFAATPVHFHHMSASALGGDNFMMINSQRWYGATSLGTDPGYASAYTVDSSPSWVMVNAATGIVTAVNEGTGIPTSVPFDTRVLTAAVSRGTDMLYTLTEVTTDSVVSAVVAHFHNNTAINTLNPVGEETIPTATNGSDTIVFSAGVSYSAATDPYMLFYGAGSSTGAIYMARKPWAHVGNVGVPTRPLLVDWEFFTGTGWSSGPTTARPVKSNTGGTLTTAGPMSFANLSMPSRSSGRTTPYALMVLTELISTTMVARAYSSLGGRPWTPLGNAVSLGTTGTTYLGGTMQLQGQLGTNPLRVNSGSWAAVPYVISTKVSSGSAHGIDTAWGTLQMPPLT